jgi:hypothetical protein
VIEFAVICEEDGPLVFRSLDEDAVAFYEARPRLPGVVRALSLAYAAEFANERVEACTVVAVARDLEKALRIVAGTREISVKPMRYEYREGEKFFDPRTGTTTRLVEQVLAEIVAEPDPFRP